VGSIAYTQYGVLPLMQVAAVAGIWGITFLIAWFASTFDLAWRNGFAWSAAGRPLAVFSVVTASVVLAGTFRLAMAARAAAVGLSAAVDPWGRVLGVTDHFAPGDSTLVAQVPIGHVPTLYARVGDVFAWLCVAGLLSMLGISALVSATRLARVPTPAALTRVSREAPAP
jgi:apolipoprotein N-acyltransferase